MSHLIGGAVRLICIAADTQEQSASTQLSLDAYWRPTTLSLLSHFNLDCGLSHGKMSTLTCCCHSGIRANKGCVQHTGSSSQGQDNLAGVSRGHTFNPLGNSQRPAPRRAQNAWAEHRGAEIAAFWHSVTVRHLPESRQDMLPQKSCSKSSQSYH